MCRRAYNFTVSALHPHTELPEPWAADPNAERRPPRHTMMTMFSGRHGVRLLLLLLLRVCNFIWSNIRECKVANLFFSQPCTHPFRCFHLFFSQPCKHPFRSFHCHSALRCELWGRTLLELIIHPGRRIRRGLVTSL